jgi:hypothetical protein
MANHFTQGCVLSANLTHSVTTDGIKPYDMFMHFTPGEKS